MRDIARSVVGFTTILIVGLVGVTVSELLRLGEMNPIITTIDNIARTR